MDLRELNSRLQMATIRSRIVLEEHFHDEIKILPRARQLKRFCFELMVLRSHGLQGESPLSTQMLLRFLKVATEMEDRAIDFIAKYSGDRNNRDSQVTT